MKGKTKRGFSLIELVVVIVILAVISAIALPRMSRGAKGADESALGQNLAVLRSSIEMYAAEHGGDFPGKDGLEDTLIAQLTQYSDRAGTTAAAPDSANGIIYGPYLHKVPPLTVGANAGESSVTMTAVTPAPNGSTGWVYDYKTGQIIANCADTEVSEAGTKYNDW